MKKELAPTLFPRWSRWRAFVSNALRRWSTLHSFLFSSCVSALCVQIAKSCNFNFALVGGHLSGPQNGSQVAQAIQIETVNSLNLKSQTLKRGLFLPAKFLAPREKQRKFRLFLQVWECFPTTGFPWFCSAASTCSFTPANIHIHTCS